MRDHDSADTAPARSFLALVRAAVDEGSFLRLVLSKPQGGAGTADRPLKVSARLLRLKNELVINLVESYRTRDLTRNLPADAAVEAIGDAIGHGTGRLRGDMMGRATGDATGQATGNRADRATGDVMSGTTDDRTVDGAIAGFGHAQLFTSTEDVQLMVTKRGRQTLLRAKKAGTGRAEGATAPASVAPELPAHDRRKNRPIAIERPYLQHLGVTDPAHRLVPAMARKWKQINKFVEVLDHALAETTLADDSRRAGAPIEVLDFGSGKGYLTFATHDHLRHTLGLPVKVTGVDLKADMVALCNRVAGQVGAEGLAFTLGDVSSHAPQRADVMIALHACDTATDHAIHAGLRAGAAIIMCSPCCHKELRPQLLSPHPLRPILKHGVHLGQQAEMLTDGLRALLLEACGYDTQVFEFVSPEQTSKNKMILAVRRPTGVDAGSAAEAVWQQVADLKAFYGIRAQCLETLLRADRADGTGIDRMRADAGPGPGSTRPDAVVVAVSRTARS